MQAEPIRFSLKICCLDKGVDCLPLDYELRDTGLEIPAAISLSGREKPLRMKLTFLEKQSTKTKKQSCDIS